VTDKVDIYREKKLAIRGRRIPGGGPELRLFGEGMILGSVLVLLLALRS